MTAFPNVVSCCSIRLSSVIEPGQLDELLAATSLQYSTGELKSIYSREVLLGRTIASLDSAGFPTDQLLGYLPFDPLWSWVYQTEEWSSTWGSTCLFIEETPLNLRRTQVIPSMIQFTASQNSEPQLIRSFSTAPNIGTLLITVSVLGSTGRVQRIISPYAPLQSWCSCRRSRPLVTT